MKKKFKNALGKMLCVALVTVIMLSTSLFTITTVEQVKGKETVKTVEKEEMHKKFQVTEKKKFKDLTPQEKTAVNLSLIQCKENGKKQRDI